MKLKQKLKQPGAERLKKALSEGSALLGSETKVVPFAKGEVKIIHHQGVKQSANYQSVDASYGVEFCVAATDEAVAFGVRKAEEIVENAIAGKFKDQQDLLKEMGCLNR